MGPVKLFKGYTDGNNSSPSMFQGLAYINSVAHSPPRVKGFGQAGQLMLEDIVLARELLKIARSTNTV